MKKNHPRLNEIISKFEGKKLHIDGNHQFLLLGHYISISIYNKSCTLPLLNYQSILCGKFPAFLLPVAPGSDSKNDFFVSISGRDISNGIRIMTSFK